MNKYELLYIISSSTSDQEKEELVKKINQLIESKLLGSTQNYISLTELRNLPFIIPSEEDLKLFNKTVAPIFKQVICNSNIIFNLIYLRDTIFPKLMLENSDSSSDKLSFI